jgi:hypothetical protein
MSFFRRLSRWFYLRHARWLDRDFQRWLARDRDGHAFDHSTPNRFNDLSIADIDHPRLAR